MNTYHGNEKVGPGIYFNLRELAFRGVDEEGRLPGGPADVWREVPALVMLLAAPALALAYVVFLPLVGFLMLGGLVLGWVGRQLRPAVVAAGRVLEPAWQPALAFLGRTRKRTRRPEPVKEPEPDAWAAEARAAVAEPPKPEAEEETK
jgi:hypothetical protein